MNRKLLFVGILLVMLGLAGVALAAAGVQIDWQVISGGGGPSSGGGVAINDTLGQPVTGIASGGDVVVSSGYWYGEIGTITNTPPTISDIPDQTIPEDSSTPAISFTVADAETNPISLTLAVESSDPALVPVGSIVFGGAGPDRSVTITPVQNGSGAVAITLTVSDGELSASDAFTLTVNPVNDAPVLSGIGDKMVILGDSLTFTATASDVEGDVLVFSLDPGAPEDASIDPASGLFTWTPAQPGEFTFTIRVSDNGVPALADWETITVTVTPVPGPSIYLPVIIR